MLFNFRPIQALKLTKRLFPKPHFRIHTIPTTPNLKPLNSKLSIYMKDGLIQQAQKLFEEMPQRNTVTWNTMIRGYFQNGYSQKAIYMYNQMPFRDIFSYNTMISGLMQCGNVKGAEEVFEGMECKDVVSWNTMISGYVSNGMVENAVRVFSEMPVKDVVSYNLVLAGLVKVEELERAEELFRGMSERDVASGTVMMKGYLGAGRIVEARACFDDMEIRDVQAWNTMMAGYIENGCVEIAESLFHKMPERDLMSWTGMVNALVSIGRIVDAMRLFNEMDQKCGRTWNSILLGFVRHGLVKEAHAILEKSQFSDVVSWTNVLIGYFDVGEVENAVKLFELMPDHDTTAWNAAIFGLGENDCSEDGVKLFIRMKEEGPSQDEATLTSFLTLCSNLSSLNLGKQAHAQIIKVGMDCCTSVGNAMVTMYCRCGNVESALLEFSSMSGHNVITWNSIICGLAFHGHGQKALEMFQKMRLTDIKPNQITFLGVLSACSHAGLVEQGKYYFDVMKNEYLLQSTSEHYTCIVDLLGRSGLIDEAIHILEQMRVDGLEVPASVWGALFGACRTHKNFKLVAIAGERILELEPSNSGVYMILAETYLASGRKEDAEKMLLRMKEKGVKKQPGCSWIESNNDGQVFLAGDRSHPEFPSIYHVLELMHMEMEIDILESNATSFEEIIEMPCS